MFWTAKDFYVYIRIKPVLMFCSSMLPLRSFFSSWCSLNFFFPFLIVSSKLSFSDVVTIKSCVLSFQYVLLHVYFFTCYLVYSVLLDQCLQPSYITLRITILCSYVCFLYYCLVQLHRAFGLTLSNQRLAPWFIVSKRVQWDCYIIFIILRQTTPVCECTS